MLEIEQRILKPQDLEKVLISFLFLYLKIQSSRGVCIFCYVFFRYLFSFLMENHQQELLSFCGNLPHGLHSFFTIAKGLVEPSAIDLNLGCK